MSSADCPSRDDLLAYVVGRLADDASEAVAVHVDSCPDCQAMLATLDDAKDTLLGGLREAAAENEFHAERECREAVALLEGMAGESSHTAVAAPLLGELGEYQLLEELGHGGMGTVYRARHTKLKRIVALKVLPKERTRDEHAIARFEREMEAVGALDHPSIVRAHDAREIEGTRFLVMEYVEGRDFSELVRRCGPLRIPDACELVRQAALGLQYVHDQGMVHRDIKPSNLMLTTSFQVKVLDLGLALLSGQHAEGVCELTGTGQMMGTLDYMAPEQGDDSHQVDIRADIYSLGATLYKLLCGWAPFAGKEYNTPAKKMMALATKPVPSIRRPRTDVPEELAAVLDRMLAKDAAGRYAVPAEVAIALAHYTAGRDLPALLKQADEATEPPAEADSPHAGTDPGHSSALVGTQPAAAPMAVPPPMPVKEGPFDPYHRWLGIPPEQQPPDHYRLLGIKRFEADADVIDGAADRQMAHLRTFQTGKRSEQAARLLNEVASARVCLLDPAKKAAYDAKLRETPPAPTRGKPRPPLTKQRPPVRPNTDPALAEMFERAKRDATAVRPRPAVRRLPTKRRIAVAIGAALAGILFLGVVLMLTGRHGTLIVETDDENVQVRVMRAGEEVAIVDVQSGWEIRLKSGQYEIDMKGAKDRLQLDRDTVTVTRGGKVTVKVMLKRTPVPPTKATAIATLRATMGDFAEPVTSFAFAPGGGTLVANGNGRGVLSLWDVLKGEKIVSKKAHDQAIVCVDFADDGRQVAAGKWKGITIWLDHGRMWHRFEEHPDLVQTVAFAPGSKLLASGDSYHSLWLWDVKSATTRWRKLNMDAHSALAFSPDGAVLASGGGDTVVHLWDVGSGNEVGRLVGHQAWIGSIDYSRDGRLLASASHDKTVRLWTVATRKEHLVLEHPDKVTSVSLSRDAAVVASGCQDGKVRLWSTGNGKLLATLSDHAGPVRHVAFAPKGDILASSGDDKTIKLWDVRITPAAAGSSAAAADDAREPPPAASSAGSPEADSDDSFQIFPGHTRTVWSVAVTPDGKFVLSASEDGTVRVWSVADGKEVRRFAGHSTGVARVVVSPDGEKVLSWAPGSAILWKFRTAEEILRLPVERDDMEWRRAAFSPDGNRAVTNGSRNGKGNLVRLWDLASGQEIGYLAHNGYSHALAFLPNGHDALCGCWDGSICRVSLCQMQVACEWKGHSQVVTGLAVSQDGQKAVSCSWDATVRVWDLRSGEQTALLKGHRGWIHSVAISADGRLAVSGGHDGTVRLWDTREGREIKQHQQHAQGEGRKSVWDVAFSPDARYVVSGGQDRKVCLWRFQCSP